MQAMWTGLLPVAIAIILSMPRLLVAFDIAPY